MVPRIALTIAGSDSGGGAGIQADLRAFAAYKVHGVCALCAVTAQNTKEVSGISTIEPDFVVKQINSVLEDFEVMAVKTGMLTSPEIIRAVAELARKGRLPNLVVDPVLVSSTGTSLMGNGDLLESMGLLLRHALVVTPNLYEASVLLDQPIDNLNNVDAMKSAALALRDYGPEIVVIKGGHLTGGVGDAGDAGDTGDPCDVIAGPNGCQVLPGTRISTKNDHGTGCALSAAIAANLANGIDAIDAIIDAKEFVRRALEGAISWSIGGGHGPLDLSGWTAPTQKI